jgi:hypothetical protein
MLVIVVSLSILLSVLRSPAESLARLTSEGRNGSASVRVSAPSGGTDTDRSRDASEGRDASPPIREGEGPGRPVLDGLLLREVRGGWRVEPGVEEAAALALIVGHGWRPDRVASEDDMGEGDPRRLVIVEAVEQPGQGAAVITLLIAPSGVRVGAPLHRVAVPVVIDADGASLGGAPWELPPPAHDRRTLEGVPVEDVELIASARRALDAVGHDGAALVALEATDGWPFIARTSTGAQLWLRWHVDRFVVTGLPLHGAAVAAPRTTSGWGEQAWEH